VTRRSEPWGAETGDAVGEPLAKGADGIVRTVAYSPDGRRIVSGCSDDVIRIWDVAAGAAIGKPLEGHAGGVWSVAYSPDGRHISSGSEDMTVRIWDADTGAVVGQPLVGHTREVQSVAYSPDGHYITTGSSKPVIRICAAIGVPMEGHSDGVWSVAYSLDGRHIISGASDRTVRISGAETGTAVGKPLRKTHSRSVVGSRWVAYRLWIHGWVSNLGCRERCCGWETHRRGMFYALPTLLMSRTSAVALTRPFEFGMQKLVLPSASFGKHTEIVASLAYSHDGRRIVSGSGSETRPFEFWGLGLVLPSASRGAYRECCPWPTFPIGEASPLHPMTAPFESCTKQKCRWEAGAVVSKPLEWHTKEVRSVTYSPDTLPLWGQDRSNFGRSAWCYCQQGGHWPCVERCLLS